MRYLLDTNALSEPLKPLPDAGYMTWVQSIPENQLATSCMVIGELYKGLFLLGEARRKDKISSFIDDIQAVMQSSTLSLDTETAVLWGKLFATAQLSGKNPSVIDSLLAAQAIQHNLTLVTRNAKDFKEFDDLKIFCPWS